MRKSYVTLLFACWLAFCPSILSAVTFTTDTLIDANNYTYDGNDIEVNNCVLTVNGVHTFNSLKVINSGTLTHSAATSGQSDYKIDLTITQDVNIAAGSSISANGKGYGSESGPGAGETKLHAGGAGYGGEGGYNSGTWGQTYGSIVEPVDLGSGGGNDEPYASGGAGGGAIRLIVNGKLRIDGSLTSNGMDGECYSIYNRSGGGGSGGSVYIVAGSIEGSGLIVADGGDSGCYGLGGCGGGGRIAIYYGTNTFEGMLTAFGGGTEAPGGAGTIFMKSSSQAFGNLFIDNGGYNGTFTPVVDTYTFDNLTVSNGSQLELEVTVESLLTVGDGATVYLQTAITVGSVDIESGGLLTHKAGQTGFNLTVLNDANIASGGSISVDGKGYGPASGPGAGESKFQAGGAGYGGEGGNNSGAWGQTYGSIVEPIDLGSGGGSDEHGATGGAGGGAIRLIVNGKLQINGSLTSNGMDGEGYSFYNRSGGGGSGGSIYIVTGTLEGSGVIAANGGSAGLSYAGGGGSGGRTVIHYGTNTFGGTLTAFGGGTEEPGGAGTIFVKSSSQSFGDLSIDNGGYSGALTPIIDTYTFDNLTISNGSRLNLENLKALTVENLLTVGNGATVYLQTAITVGSVDIESGGLLTHKAGQTGFNLTVLNDANIASGGSISVDGKGYGPASGPGAGESKFQAGGAGYGGEGGNNSGAWGQTYGSIVEPIDLGSGGGSDEHGATGGAGGGLIRLNVNRTLQIDGVLTVKGNKGKYYSFYNRSGGGGAGGSVYIVAGSIKGSGLIAADGGDSGLSGLGGGGGGGRITIYYEDTSDFNLGNISASGGSGYQTGQSGTVLLIGPDETPIISVDTLSAGYVLDPFDHVDIVFTRPIDPNTFTSEDVYILGPNGEVHVTGIVLTNEIASRETYSVYFPIQTANGTYRVTIGTDIMGANGQPISEGYEATFILDSIGPRITKHSPAGDLAGTIEFVDIWFSEILHVPSLSLDDIMIEGPSGSITPTALADIGLSGYRISFPEQTTYGQYHVLIGPEIEDIAGNTMDQDRDGTRGEPNDDAYDASFNLVDVDLTLSNVLVDANKLWAGELVDVSWEGYNYSGMPLLGSWVDAVYLSEDDQWDIDDRLLTKVSHTGGLAQDESYLQDVTVLIPGALPGDYYIIVRADVHDDEKEGAGEGDNIVPVGPNPLSVEVLSTDGVPIVGWLSDGNHMDYYKIDVNNGQNLSLVLEQFDANSVIDFFVSYEIIPTRLKYDYRSIVNIIGNQETILPATLGGSYYVLVYGDQITGESSYNLTADTPDLIVTCISPEHHGQASLCTMTLTGGDFNEATTVEFKGTDESIWLPTSIQLISRTTLVAEINTPIWPIDIYDITVSRPGVGSFELPDAFEVITGIPHLDARVIVPDQVGYHWFVIIWIEYANTGGASMPSPLFKLHGSDDAIMTLDNSVARVGLWTDTPPAGTSDTIQVMATGSGATPGILQPGDSGRIPVYYLGLKQPWNMSDRSISFDLGVLTIENTETINWSLLEDQMRPADVDVDAWHAVFLNLAERIGSTWGDYVAKLNENMNYLFSVGQTVNESQRLWNFELMQASDLLNPYCFDSVTDAVSPAPSLPLMFTRSRSKGILGQYNLGALGRGWAHNWDIHGEGTRTDPDGMVWQFRQDGLLDYVEDRNGNRITVGYTSGQLTSITHSNGDQLLLDYNPDGRIWHLVDPRSLDPNDDRVTVFEYDASGEYLMEVSAPGSRVTNYTYETAGTPQQKHAILSVEYPDNSHKYFVYDSNGRLEETYRDGGAEPITYTYDIPGQVIVEGCGGCSNIKTTYCYAADGQIAQIRDGIGSVTRFSYDYTGNLIKVTGPDGQQYRYSYDDNGNVVSFEDPLRKITTFTYESNFNKPRSITDARGNNIKYNYDTAGNLLSIIYEDSNSESYNYYPDGSIHTWTNRRGQTITYDYYDNGLVAHKDYSTTPEPNDYIYGYDTAGNLILAADPCGSITMTYDPNTSWLTRIDYPQGRCFIFEYDAMGRRTKRTDQDNHMIKYIYDAVGRLNLVTDSNDVNIVDYDYDSDGRLDVKTLGNEVYTVYNYNAAGHVTNVVNHRPDDSILSSFFYTYDASGRRTSMTTLAGTYVYGYDPLGQLTSVTYPSDYVVEYVYDAVGNRIRIIDKGTPILYTTNNMNQYEDVNGAFYTYDYDGCLETRIEGGITTYYTHDIERRLVQVSEPNDTWVYAYDGLGNRVKSTYNEVSTEYIVDPIGYGNVAAEYNADGNLTVEYLYGHGLLARVNQTGDNAYYTFDALGSTVEITDVAGNPLNNYVYDPFGIILTQSETIPNPFKYIGEDGVMEEGNGLKFMRARYYEPLTGRFIQPDPLGIKGGLNLYTYAENDPINKKDPLGLVSDDYSRCVDNCELVCKYGRWLLMVIIGVLLLVFALQAAALYTKVLILMFSGAFGSFLGTFCHEFCKFKCYIEVEVPLLAQEVPAERLDYRGYGISHMVDPSDKLGPAGFSNAKYVGKDNLMAYKIRFENELNATAPAHFIKITDTFDDDLDLSTFELEEIAFAGYTIIVPEGLSHYETTMEIEVDNEYVSSAQLLMEIDASLNYSTRELTFSMIGLDPNTGWLPENIAIGVLYPNDANGRGDGHISFTVKPKPNLPSGSKIMNKASIKFDWNDELITPLVLNTIDANAPTSTVSELPAESNDLSVNVSWAGADDANGSGIGSYNIYVSDNNGVYVLWLEGTTDTSATFIGEHGHTYRFYSVATDNVGYVEQEPNAPDATVAIYDRTVPQIVSVVINNGQAQRSRIDKFAVKFNEDLSVTKDILTLYNNTTGMDVNLSSLTTGDFDYNDVNFTATWDLSGTVFEDGNHIATISAALVVDTGGNYLDGNGDGTGGDDFTYDFVRLLGDFDGNGQVDCVDLAQFVEKWLWIGPAGDVLEDLQVDGTVNLLDFAALAERWAGSQ